MRNIKSIMFVTVTCLFFLCLFTFCTGKDINNNDITDNNDNTNNNVDENDDVIFYEGFESNSNDINNLTSGNVWKQNYIIGEIPWILSKGGNNEHPSNSFEGNNNLIFTSASYNGDSTYLDSPAIDMSNISSDAKITFAHAQAKSYEDQDQLKVFYSIDGINWELIPGGEYLDNIPEWVVETLSLPLSAGCTTYYIRFQGISGYADGVVIDEVTIMK